MTTLRGMQDVGVNTVNREKVMRESKLPLAQGEKTELTKAPWRQRVTPARHKSQLQEKSLFSRKMIMG